MERSKKIVDYLNVETIDLNLNSKDKDSVIKELYENIKKTGLVKDEELGYKDICLRESIGSTGIGKGFALPHAKTGAVDQLILTLGISKEGIDFEAIDEKKSKIFFMFLCPEEDTQEYLRLLARISRWTKDKDFKEALLNANSNMSIIEIMENMENGKS